MSDNAELIADALAEYGTDREHMHEVFSEGYHVPRFIDALEAAEAERDAALAVIAEAEARVLHLRQSDSESVPLALDVHAILRKAASAPLDPAPFKHRVCPERAAGPLLGYDFAPYEFAPREGYDQNRDHYPTRTPSATESNK